MLADVQTLVKACILDTRTHGKQEKCKEKHFQFIFSVLFITHFSTLFSVFNISEMFNVSNDEGGVGSCYKSYIVTKATKSYIINSIIGCIANGVLCFVGTFLNALVVYLFWKTPQLRETVSYFMIMVLSSIDIFVTLILHPAHLVMSIAEIIGNPKCVYKTFYHIATVVLSGMSFLTLFVMNVERYLSIVHPIFHFKHVTKMRCFMVSSIFWSILVVCCPVLYLLNYNIQVFVAITALIIILGTCYIYLMIFYVARKRRQALSLSLNVRRKEENSNACIVEDLSRTDDALSDYALSYKDIKVSIPENLDRKIRLSTCNNQAALKHGESGEKSTKAISFLHDLRLAKMYLLIVLSSFALNLPNALVLAMFRDDTKTLDILVQIKIWTITLVYMNSTVNSLIFFWANEALRTPGWKVCKRLLGR